MMITVQEAFRIVTESVLPIVAEKLSLPYLQGRMLAEDVAAPFPLPRFTNAAMDGFALRMDDISGLSDGSPSRLTITQEIAAGALSSFPVFSGCCAQIMTGAPMPEGADTVVPFEDTSGFDGESVLVYKAPKPKANVRYRGEEVCEGELLLRKGTLVTPAEIAVLASFGFASALVSGLPKVAILTVGDELRMPGDHAENAAIYNCNQFMLEAACRASGVGITVIGHARMSGMRCVKRFVMRWQAVIFFSLPEVFLPAGTILCRSCLRNMALNESSGRWRKSLENLSILVSRPINGRFLLFRAIRYRRWLVLSNTLFLPYLVFRAKSCPEVFELNLSNRLFLTENGIVFSLEKCGRRTTDSCVAQHQRLSHT